MKPVRLFAIASALMVALGTVAQQQPEPAGPTVEVHLKMLTEKLGLTRAQQAKAKPILQEMSDAQQKIRQDDSLSHQERQDRIRPVFEKADKKLRKVLNDAQKIKLDQLEHKAHAMMRERNGDSGGEVRVES
jgi:hypothetical protein